MKYKDKYLQEKDSKEYAQQSFENIRKQNVELLEQIERLQEQSLQLDGGVFLQCFVKRRQTMNKYNIIYADPPWAYLWGKGKDGGHFAPEKHYQTLSTDEICKLNVKSLADKNCALFLWATMPTLPDAIRVIKEWGFKYKTCAFCWVKTKKDGKPLSGMGSYTKANAELCLLAMRGHIKSVDKTVPQIIMRQRMGHSVKPPEARERIKKLFGDIPAIELFARQKTDGWDVLGNEIDGKDIREVLK